MITTCQICGRAIRTVTYRSYAEPVIADHGYTQPWLRYGTGDGSRTARCAGSRHLPYEVSRDAIPPTRDRYEDRVRRNAWAYATLVAEPPATISWRDRYRQRADVVVERPDGFDPIVHRRSYGMRSYEQLFWARLQEIVADNRGTLGFITYLSQRYDEWKGVAS